MASKTRHLFKLIRNDNIFIMTSRCHKGSLPLVPLTYMDKVVCTSEVRLSEDPGSWLTQNKGLNII